MSEIEDKIEQIGEKWEYVVITHRPQYEDDFRWVVANHTDEGLGPDELIETRAESLEEAINKALEGDYWEGYT